MLNFLKNYLNGLICKFQEIEKTESEHLKGSKKNYYIKSGYNPRENPEYFDDIIKGVTYQPQVYDLAFLLAKKSNAKYIIDIGSGSGIKLKKFEDDFQVIAVDYGKNIKILKKNLTKAKVLSWNLEKGLPKISNRILNQSIIICADVLEHLIEPNLLLKSLSEISLRCLFILISTPDRDRCRGINDFGPPLNPSHVREWNIQEFRNMLTRYGFKGFLSGYTVDNDIDLKKTTIIVISGKFASFRKIDKNIKMLAIITQYNESDIIVQNIKYLISMGIDVHVIDNWSNDGSFEKVKRLQKRYSNVSLERFPRVGPSKYYEWIKILKRIESIANKAKYNWIIHYDSDEIRESPWPYVNLYDGIVFVDSLGFNAIDFTVLNYRFTKTTNNFSEKRNPLTYFKYCEFGDHPGHFIQVKAWKKTNNNIELASSGGHNVLFKGRKVYPIKFLIRHYPLRSTKQAYRKVFFERFPRFSPDELKMGFHSHYNQYKGKKIINFKEKKLINGGLNSFKEDYIVELISGIGLKQKIYN